MYEGVSPGPYFQRANINTSPLKVQTLEKIFPSPILSTELELRLDFAALRRALWTTNSMRVYRSRMWRILRTSMNLDSYAWSFGSSCDDLVNDHQGNVSVHNSHSLVRGSVPIRCEKKKIKKDKPIVCLAGF